MGLPKESGTNKTNFTLEPSTVSNKNPIFLFFLFTIELTSQHISSVDARVEQRLGLAMDLATGRFVSSLESIEPWLLLIVCSTVTGVRSVSDWFDCICIARFLEHHRSLHVHCPPERPSGEVKCLFIRRRASATFGSYLTGDWTKTVMVIDITWPDYVVPVILQHKRNSDLTSVKLLYISGIAI